MAMVLIPGAAGDTRLGHPLTMEKAKPIAELLAQADSHLGRPVLVKGKIVEVCEMAGCWMKLLDPSSGKSIVIKVNDGEIVFPIAAVGKTAIAEGRLEKIEMTVEQAIAWLEHRAKENKKPFDPKSVTGPMTLYQIRGTGAVIVD